MPFEPIRQIHGRLRIRNEAGTLIDVSDYLIDAEVNEGDISGVGTQSGGSDNVVQTLFFTLQNEDEDRFNPRDQDSVWNTVAGSYSPLLWPNREVIFEYDITDPGETPTWTRLFDGLLGDTIVADGPRVRVECRDKSKRLQDRLITERREYGAEGGRRADLVIEDILDDEFGTGEIDLIVEDIPDFFILPYFVEYRSVWDAIQEIVNQFGWFLGQRFHGPSGEYRLTLLEPPRDKTAIDFNYTADDHYYSRELEFSDRDIRNEVHIIYRDAGTGERAEVVVDDSASIADFGVRRMLIEEGDSRLITSEASAEALAEYAIHDLSQPRSDFQVELALHPELEIYSTFSVDDEKISSTVDFFGVDSVTHRFDFQSPRFRTSAIATERVIGGHLRWIRSDARPGARKPVETGELAPGVVIADRIQDGTVTGIKLEDGSVIEAKLADDSVSTGKLQDSAVVSVKLADGSVIEIKVDEDAISSGKIQDGAVITVKLDDGSVVEGKIADLAVSEGKIQDGAVTEDKYADDSIDTPKIMEEATAAGRFTQIIDEVGTVTTSTTFVDIPDFELSFFLAEDDSVLLMYYTMWIRVNTDADDLGTGRVRMLVDDGVVDTTFTEMNIANQSEAFFDSPVSSQWFLTLDSGSHDMQGQFAVPEGDSIESYNRTLGLILFKR